MWTYTCVINATTWNCRWKSSIHRCYFSCSIVVASQLPWHSELWCEFFFYFSFFFRQQFHLWQRSKHDDGCCYHVSSEFMLSYCKFHVTMMCTFWSDHGHVTHYVFKKKLNPKRKMLKTGHFFPKTNNGGHTSTKAVFKVFIGMWH